MVSNTSLAPGFRFHPTDEELVRYYLRRKICGKPFRLDAISEIDIYRTEPWDLPGMSKLKTRDLEWYFFSFLDKKYGNGSRTNRATEKGYWKTTGKDRAVLHRSQLVGMKKTLVYHFGRAPRGERTNWVMHEYRLMDEALDKAGFVQDSFVLCRVFQKSGPGPKNGEQYGAPLIEEEWEDDEFEHFLKEEAKVEMEVGDDAYLDENDIDQILGAEVRPEDVPLLRLEHNPGEGDLFVGGSSESIDDSQKFMISLEDYTCEEEQPQNDHMQKLLDSSEGCDFVQEQIEDKTSHAFSVDQKQVKHEYIGESSKALVLEGMDQKNYDQYVDATDNFGSDLGPYFESDDLMNPLDLDTSAFDMLEEYLAFSDANDGMSDYLTFDPPLVGGSEDLISAELPTSQDVIEKTQPVVSSEQPWEHQDDASSSSRQTLSKYGTDFQQHPFIKQASQMLMGNVHAPPAYASEFPSQYLKSGSPASSSVHVTAGMIQIRNSSQVGSGSDMFHGKDGLCNIMVSFGMSRGDDNSTTLESVVRILPGKAVSALFGGGSFYFMLLSIIALSLSCKMGSFIFAQ